MSILITDCPRCGVKQISFDVISQIQVDLRDDWQRILELFCVCRSCFKSTTFLVRQTEYNYGTHIDRGLAQAHGSINDAVTIERYVGIQDHSVEPPPEYLPEDIERVFKEGAACMAIGCNNAAATMFRLCLDLATKALLPEQAEGLNGSIRRNLGLRLIWLFDNSLLPEALRDLSTCIKDDGNDGAHEGILTKEDAADILDFTFILLERLYTEPKRLELAGQRRMARRAR